MLAFIAGSLATLVIILACIAADQSTSGGRRQSASSSSALYTSSREVRNAGGSYRSTTAEVTRRRTISYEETPRSRRLEYTVEGPPDAADALVMSAVAQRMGTIYPAAGLPAGEENARRILQPGYRPPPARPRMPPPRRITPR